MSDLFAKDILKKQAMEMLSEALIPFNPKAKVSELRELLLDHELVSRDPIKAPLNAVKILGLKYHDCDMGGQVLEIRSGTEYVVDGWKAEALVNFGACEFV